MSTNSRIGYLENGLVKSIYCHWDGYPSWNGVVLHECYRDIDRVKELVDRKGYISVLKPTVRNTDFAGYPLEDETRLETVDNFKKDAFDYHYLFDAENGGWTVFYRGLEGKMMEVVADSELFGQLEQLEPEMIEEAFERMTGLREKLKNGYQTWREPEGGKGRYLESWFVPDEKVVVILDGFTDKRCWAIPCLSLEDAREIGERILGKSLEEIECEFGTTVENVIAEASGRTSDVVRENGKEVELG